jgi:hypothetical protein
MSGSAAARTRIPAVAALIVVPLLIHTAIVETGRGHVGAVTGLGSVFRIGLVGVCAITHWMIYGGLLLTFGLTLRPGRDALITAMARKLHGTIPQELVVYTRRVTVAWCGFFAAQLATSVTLFFFAPLVVWSLFVNVFDLPLVAAMFAAEYMCRLRCLQNPPRHSLAQIVRMVAEIRKPAEEPASAP